MENRTCRVCGETFTPTHHSQKDCPPTTEDRARAKGQPRSKCAKRWLNHKQRGTPLIVGKVGQPFDCAWCGRRCVPGDDGIAPHATRFCCRTHKARWHRVHVEGQRSPIERAAARLANPKTGQPRLFIAGHCHECSATFVGIGVAARYCCAECKHQRDLRIKTIRNSKASLRVASIGPRDGWTCGICGDRVDATLSDEDRMSATVDHIVPLSRRGSHDDENVQLAHRLCNSLKSDRLSGPMEV